MKNIEIKVKINNFKETFRILAAIRAKKIAKLIQVDTYYVVKGKARLKIREINNKEFELIYYKRPDVKKSKFSDYKIINLSRADNRNLKAIFNEILGILAVVKKERNLWIYKNTRIHIDKVSKLGNFIELETVMNNIELNNAKIEHGELIKLLKLNHYKRQAGSYSDLLLKNKA